MNLTVFRCAQLILLSNFQFHLLRRVNEDLECAVYSLDERFDDISALLQCEHVSVLEYALHSLVHLFLVHVWPLDLNEL